MPWYTNYGPLFESLMGKRYNLRAHAVTVSEGVANAFIAPDGSHIYPVALVEGSSATLELRGVPANVTAVELYQPACRLTCTRWPCVAPLRSILTEICLCHPCSCQ